MGLISPLFTWPPLKRWCADCVADVMRFNFKIRHNPANPLPEILWPQALVAAERGPLSPGTRTSATFAKLTVVSSSSSSSPRGKRGARSMLILSFIQIDFYDHQLGCLRGAFWEEKSRSSSSSSSGHEDEETANGARLLKRSFLGGSFHQHSRSQPRFHRK